jgi:hypothetical protein
MRTFLRRLLPAITRCLLLLAIPLGLTGCAGEDSTSRDESPLVEEQDSPIHDIRMAEWGVWSGTDVAVEAFLPEDRDGWTFEWRVGNGRISGVGREVVWTTPLADSSWIESTLHRGPEEYTCRRWLGLLNDPPTLDLQLAGGEMPGVIQVRAVVNRPLPASASWGWATDSPYPLSGIPSAMNWELHGHGEWRIWAAVRLGGREARDTLSVIVPNIAPEFGPAMGENWGPYPCGSVFEDWIRVDDVNDDGLSLELVELDGLELLDSSWTASQQPECFQGSWKLTLRDTGTGSGPRRVLARISDGDLSAVLPFAYVMECP